MPGRSKIRALGALAAALSYASAFQPQKPLADTDQQQHPLTNTESTFDKPLVDSETLQAKINKDNLLARAKELYEIAKLSEDEYNHPTRVIGSPGKI